MIRQAIFKALDIEDEALSHIYWTIDKQLRRLAVERHLLQHVADQIEAEAPEDDHDVPDEAINNARASLGLSSGIKDRVEWERRKTINRERQHQPSETAGYGDEEAEKKSPCLPARKLPWKGKKYAFNTTNESHGSASSLHGQSKATKAAHVIQPRKCKTLVVGGIEGTSKDMTIAQEDTTSVFDSSSKEVEGKKSRTKNSKRYDLRRRDTGSCKRSRGASAAHPGSAGWDWRREKR